jgi:hypothetical protein
MGWPQQQEKVTSPVEPLSISELFEDFDLKLPIDVEPRGPKVVER